MAFAYKDLDTEVIVLDHTAIHTAACTYARNEYTKEYSIDKSQDKQYAPGNERHTFWLNAYDKKQASLILNPHQ